MAQTTLRDVATHAGVSVRTVSNVVNGYVHVSPAMRTKVLAAIEELNYSPNVLARNLRSGRTGILGLVVPEIDVPYFSELARKIIGEAARLDYRVMIEHTDGDPDTERALLTGGSRGLLFDGVIYSTVQLEIDDLRDLSPALPIVLIGEHTKRGAFDHVAIDNVQAARDATEHLISLGRTRIAAIGNEPFDTARLRTAGYHRALRDAGLMAEPDLLVEVEHFHREDGARAAERLLALPEPPDAIFCYADLLALGAQRAVLAAGLRVPEDIAIIGVDDIEDGRYATPTLSTIAPDKHFIARQAVELLAARIGDRGREVRELVAPHALLVRESSAGVSVRARAR